MLAGGLALLLLPPHPIINTSTAQRIGAGGYHMIHAALIAELERDEGLRLKPYQDSKGILTIGIGRNLRDRGVSREEAYHMLNNDLESVEADLDQHLPWWRSLNEVRQRVIANMCFNMGINTLLQFRHSLALIQSGDYEAAAVEMLASEWAREVGPRAQRLSNAMRDGVT